MLVAAKQAFSSRPQNERCRSSEQKFWLVSSRSGIIIPLRKPMR